MNNTSLFYSGWIVMNSGFCSLTTSDDLFNEPKKETDGIRSQITAGVKRNLHQKQQKPTSPAHHPLHADDAHS